MCFIGLDHWNILVIEVYARNYTVIALTINQFPIKFQRWKTRGLKHLVLGGVSQLFNAAHCNFFQQFLSCRSHLSSWAQYSSLSPPIYIHIHTGMVIDIQFSTLFGKNYIIFLEIQTFRVQSSIASLQHILKGIKKRKNF